MIIHGVITEKRSKTRSVASFAYMSIPLDSSDQPEILYSCSYRLFSSVCKFSGRSDVTPRIARRSKAIKPRFVIYIYINDGKDRSRTGPGPVQTGPSKRPVLGPGPDRKGPDRGPRSRSYQIEAEDRDRTGPANTMRHYLSPNLNIDDLEALIEFGYAVVSHVTSYGGNDVLFHD